MTKLSLEEVEHIAELAKLALTDDEKARYRDQLSAILDYAERLQQIPTDDIPPTASVLPVDTVLREDASRPSTPTKELLANAPAQEAEMFKVRVVIE
jgi:aspartyl-tRNA(Asn)/glutamyl-tRNA(Gln) amidotransferase subunit C